MTEYVLVGLASILVLGIWARWLAWWLRLPAILLLLCGPLLGRVYARGLVAHELPGTLSFHNGKLTAQIEAAPLQEVMEAIGELSGAEVVWLQDCGTETVSADFSNVPLPRALRLILGRNNFLLFYSSANEEASLSQIWISGQDKKPSTLPVPAKAAIGVLHQLQKTALRGRNLSERLQAVEQLKRYAQVDSRARNMLTHLARWANHPQVRREASAAMTSLQARK